TGFGVFGAKKRIVYDLAGNGSEGARYPLSLVGVETNIIPSFRVNRPVSVDVFSVEAADDSGTFTRIDPPHEPWQVSASQIEDVDQPPRVVRVRSDGFFSLDVLSG